MATLPLAPPKFRAFNANGAPLAGGQLYSYAAGTTTPLNTFTTRAGDIANSNPVILNANGEADVWTTPGLLYKFVLADASGVVQWTVDNVPSGVGQTVTSNAAPNTIDPGGRLTLTSGTPVTMSDVIAATTVYYTQLNHDQVPLYDGTSWALSTFPELSHSLSDSTKSPTAAVAGKVYDMFVWNDAGTLRLSRGFAWAADGSRGTGAGTTELTRIGGRLVNAFSISNGAAAHQGTYVGTIYVAGDGKVYDSASERLVWNAYNRVARAMKATDATTSWAYSTAAWRQANGSSTNGLEFVTGLAAEPVSAEVVGRVTSLGTGVTLRVNVGVGIGLDSSAVNSASPSRLANYLAPDNGQPASAQNFVPVSAHFQDFPNLGRHTLRWLEFGSGQSGVTDTFFGTGTTYQSGIYGQVFA